MKENICRNKFNHGEAYAPEPISRRSICIDGDIGEVLYRMNAERIGHAPDIQV